MIKCRCCFWKAKSYPIFNSFCWELFNFSRLPTFWKPGARWQSCLPTCTPIWTTWRPPGSCSSSGPSTTSMPSRYRKLLGSSLPGPYNPNLDWDVSWSGNASYGYKLPDVVGNVWFGYKLSDVVRNACFGYKLSDVVGTNRWYDRWLKSILWRFQAMLTSVGVPLEKLRFVRGTDYQLSKAFHFKNQFPTT